MSRCKKEGRVAAASRPQGRREKEGEGGGGDVSVGEEEA